MENMKRSKKLIACVVVLAGSLGLYAGGKSRNETAQNNPNETTNPTGSANRVVLSSEDSEFMQKAAMGGLLEVELGRLATQKGSSDVVKQFGQRMIDDHSKANQELQQIASS